MLKNLFKNLNSLKCYDKANMRVCALSLWENFIWGLTYFDEFLQTIFLRTYEAILLG